MSNIANRLPPVGGYNNNNNSHHKNLASSYHSTAVSNGSICPPLPSGGHISTGSQCTEFNNNQTHSVSQVCGNVQQLSISAGDFQVHCGYNNEDENNPDRSGVWMKPSITATDAKVIMNSNVCTGDMMRMDKNHFRDTVDSGRRMLKHCASSPNIPASSCNNTNSSSYQQKFENVNKGEGGAYRNPVSSGQNTNSQGHHVSHRDQVVDNSLASIGGIRNQITRTSHSFNGQFGWVDDDHVNPNTTTQNSGHQSNSRVVQDYSQNNSKLGNSGMGNHGGQDSYSSGYSGMSESPSSGSPYNTRDADSHSIHSGYLNDYSEVGSCIRKVIRQKVLPAASAEVEISTDNETTLSTFTQSTLLAPDDYVHLEKCPKLVQDLGRDVPWNDNEILHVLREGRTKHMSGHITVEMMQRLAFLLQRPLLRITQEARRLSVRLNMCTKHEVDTALKLALSRPIAQSCQQACAKALTLYTMSGDGQKQSKSARCGLKFSVGRFHRWLILAGVGLRVHEFSAICLAACMENLLEEVVLRALAKEKLGESVWSLDILEYGISANAELWGLLQPYQHLICGRNAFGVVSLPSDYEGCVKSSERQYEQETLEQCMLATCVGSLSELGYLVYEVMHAWYLDSRYRMHQKQRSVAVYWSPDSLHTLYHYLKCPETGDRGQINISTDRAYNLSPPLYEWVRSIVAFTEHRGCCMVTPRDVEDGVRLLLPGNHCPPVRPEFVDNPSLLPTRKWSGPEAQTEMQRGLLQSLLFGGHYELFGETLGSLGVLGKDILNSQDDKGITMLMQASIQGNEDAILTLLNNGAAINSIVPNEGPKLPQVHPVTRGWTGLHFAVSFNHPSVVQRLLDRGAYIEGCVKTGEENVVVTPLQLACAAGHLELVNLLLSKGADPYLNTSPKTGGVSFTYNRGGISAFSMAAMHGHREVLKILLRQPVLSVSDNLLSLEEILEEGSAPGGGGSGGPTKDRRQRSGSREDLTDQHSQSKAKNYHIYEEIPGESIYQSIEDTLSLLQSANHPFRRRPNNKRHNKSKGANNDRHKAVPRHSSNQPITSQHSLNQPVMFSASSKAAKEGFISHLSKTQLRLLQDALYNAAENGFLDAVMELRITGLPWSLYTWSRCVEYSFESGKLPVLESLMVEFQESFTLDDITADFLRDTVPLLFDILKMCKEGDLKLKISESLMYMFGKEPLPKLRNFKLEENPMHVKIEPRFLNNPELSDVHFLVEGKTFYAHKMALVQQSQRLRAMLTNTYGDATIPVVELHDVRYKIFKYVMQYLYLGPQDLNVESKDIIELFGSAHFFMLEGLQRYCETLCTKKITEENCVTIYKNAKLFNATELIKYCEGFFLQNLSSLLSSNESFHKMIYSSKRQTYNLLGGVMATLTEKLEAKLENKRKLAPGIRV